MSAMIHLNPLGKSFSTYLRLLMDYSFPFHMVITYVYGQYHCDLDLLATCDLLLQ